MTMFWLTWLGMVPPHVTLPPSLKAVQGASGWFVPAREKLLQEDQVVDLGIAVLDEVAALKRAEVAAIRRGVGHVDRQAEPHRVARVARAGVVEVSAARGECRRRATGNDERSRQTAERASSPLSHRVLLK